MTTKQMHHMIILVASVCAAWLGACGGREAVCGDGVLEGAEACDDGNLDGGDGCSQVCAVEAGLCNTAIAVEDPVVVTGTTTGSFDFALSECQVMFGGFDGPDIAYVFTPTSELLHISLVSEADHGIAVRSTCDDRESELSCADAFFGGFEETLDLQVTPGEPLYIIIGAFSAGDAGPFALDISSRPAVCGDGLLEGDEQCDDANTETGDGCDDTCRFELVCGDGFVAGTDPGGNEECDDGNTNPGDGCSDTCQAESLAEVEPNDDGTPNVGEPEAGAYGNDFDPNAAQGPFTADVIVRAALEPAGDEDIFLIQNPDAYNTSVRLDTYKIGLGLGVSCGEVINTVITMRDAAGLDVDLSVDREPNFDSCSGLDVLLAPGASLYAHVTDFDDDEVIDGYFLSIAFASCGDAVVEGLEQCDDGNHDPGDGCDANCRTE